MYHLAAIAAGCIVQAHDNSKELNRRNFGVWNSHGQRGNMSLAVPGPENLTYPSVTPKLVKRHKE